MLFGPLSVFFWVLTNHIVVDFIFRTVNVKSQTWNNRNTDRPQISEWDRLHNHHYESDSFEILKKRFKIKIIGGCKWEYDTCSLIHKGESWVHLRWSYTVKIVIGTDGYIGCSTKSSSLNIHGIIQCSYSGKRLFKITHWYFWFGIDCSSISTLKFDRIFGELDTSAVI